MRILTLTVLLGLPLMALGQTEPQQPTQEQTKETQTTAPAKPKKMRPEQAEPGKPEAKPETGTNVRGQTKIKGQAPDVNKNESGARSSTSTSTGMSQTTTVNKQEFRSRHSEVFSLGRHPKEFFVQRYGASHFRMIGNTYFVFVDGCWVAVDVDGFVYTERVICAGDPDFVEVD
jgi:cytoskeletal protein RodZ